MSEDYAMDVMKIAYKYQVTACQVFCSKFLRGILRADNACYILEQAHLLDDNDLFRTATDFIDDNAPAVIESEGFKKTSPETLEYLLKGNTFYASEVDILTAVDEWASNYLFKNNMTAHSDNKRLVMGKGFYWLRLPTLDLHDFIAAQMKYGYLTNEEQDNITRYIALKETRNICTSSEKRRPRKAGYWRSVLECQEPMKISLNRALVNVFTLTCTKNIELEQILLLLQKDQLIGAKCTVEVSSNENVITVNEYSLTPIILNGNLKLEPPLPLKASAYPYKIKVTLAKPDDFNPVVSVPTVSSIGPSSVPTRFGISTTSAVTFHTACTTATSAAEFRIPTNFGTSTTSAIGFGTTTTSATGFGTPTTSATGLGTSTTSAAEVGIPFTNDAGFRRSTTRVTGGRVPSTCSAGFGTSNTSASVFGIPSISAGGLGNVLSKKCVSVQTERDKITCHSWMDDLRSVNLECSDWQSYFIQGIKYINNSYRDQV